jgi:hypothetical protein
MRCMTCGVKMILMNVIPDDTLTVPGSERHTFIGSECGDFDGRLVYTKRDRNSVAGPMPVHGAPSIAPPSTVHDVPVVTPGLFRRALAKLRSR